VRFVAQPSWEVTSNIFGTAGKPQSALAVLVTFSHQKRETNAASCLPSRLLTACKQPRDAVFRLFTRCFVGKKLERCGQVLVHPDPRPARGGALSLCGPGIYDRGD